MMSFRSDRLPSLPVSLDAVAFLADIAESKGRQELLVRRAPRALVTLMATARIQSIESSNRIEGVVAEPGRLAPLLSGRARARSRPEHEIVGYRRALDLVYTKGNGLRIEPATLLHLHRLALEGAVDAGKWKTRDNEIVEMRAGRPTVVRFRAVSARRTAAAVQELCVAYRASLASDGRIPGLVAAAAFVLDVLCIHPFRDGNGRVSRLLTHLLLLQHGFEVGRYVGLERIVEDSRDGYDRALNRSSSGWHRGRHDLGPWLLYFLAIVRKAFRELEEVSESLRDAKGSKQSLAESVIRRMPGRFTLAELERACPAMGRETIRLVLKRLRRERTIRSLGRGPGAQWELGPGAVR